jgi:hypothetical protein
MSFTACSPPLMRAATMCTLRRHAVRRRTIRHRP